MNYIQNTHNTIFNMNESLYTKSVNELSPTAGRFRAIPVAFADVAMDTLQHPFSAIESLVRGITNLCLSPFGQTFPKKNSSGSFAPAPLDSLRRAVVYTEFSLKSAAATPAALVMAVPKFFYQTIAVLYDPKNATAISQEKVSNPYGTDQIVPLNLKSSVWEATTFRQGSLYLDLNEYSKTNPILGRCRAIPMAFRDVVLDTFSVPLRSIESLFRAAANLLGCLFLKDYSMKRALMYTEQSFSLAVQTPVVFLTAIPKFIFQIGATLWDPTTVESINPFAKRYAEHQRAQAEKLAVGSDPLQDKEELEAQQQMTEEAHLALATPEETSTEQTAVVDKKEAPQSDLRDLWEVAGLLANL